MNLSGTARMQCRLIVPLLVVGYGSVPFVKAFIALPRSYLSKLDELYLKVCAILTKQSNPRRVSGKMKVCSDQLSARKPCARTFATASILRRLP
jgi:hypothetical protein